MTDEIIETVNKDVLRGFKTLQKNKNILYTSSDGNYLTSINDKSMIVYANAKEIDFEGTFKLARNKLIPVEQSLDTNPGDAISLSNFDKLKTFDRTMFTEFQKYCYVEQLYVNIAEIFDTVIRLFEVYANFTLYKSNKSNEIMLVFTNRTHKTFLLSKLL